VVETFLEMMLPEEEKISLNQMMLEEKKEELT
jgi:hypothetical protein